MKWVRGGKIVWANDVGYKEVPAVCEGRDRLEGCHVPLYRGLSAAVLGTVSLIGGLAPAAP